MGPSPMLDVKFTPRLLNLPMINSTNIDHITSLERTLCSNFFCCGVQLADFHALLEHFEENHVVVLAPNGKRVYPREGLRSVPLDPASGSCTPSSSRASSVSPASPLSPQSPLTSPSVSRKSSFSVPPVYTPFTPSLPVDPADPLLDSSEIVMSQEHDFDFSLHHPTFLPPLVPEISSEHSSSSSEDEGTSPTDSTSSSMCMMMMDHEKDPISGRSLHHVRFIGSSDKRNKMDKPISKSGKSRRHHPSGSHSKRREKMYRCPKNGCVKAYLNPNGLKYHLEKGTCKFAEDEDDPMMQDRTDLAPPPKRSCPNSPNSTPITDPLDSVPKIIDGQRSSVHSNPSAPLQEGVPVVLPPQPPLSSTHASHSFGASSSNYGHHHHPHHPVAMNNTWGTTYQVEKTQCSPHSYPLPVEVATATATAVTPATAAQHFIREEREEHPSSPTSPLSSSSSSAPPPPAPLPQPSTHPTLGQSVPQYVIPLHQHQQQQQIQFHYPVPTYPNGYIYAQQQQQQQQQLREYFATAERATYDPSVSGGGGVASSPSS